MAVVDGRSGRSPALAAPCIPAAAPLTVGRASPLPSPASAAAAQVIARYPLTTAMAAMPPTMRAVEPTLTAMAPGVVTSPSAPFQTSARAVL